MDKWKYKYSFIGGILFLVSFFMKELVLYSPKAISIAIFTAPYIFMVIYVIALFLGFVKYAILNDNHILKMSSISLIVFYSVIIIIELLDRVFNITGISALFIMIPQLLLAASLILWSITIILQKKIYGKYTYIQGFSSFILGISFAVPFLIYIQFPVFLMLFISLTYLIKKNENKINPPKKEPRLL